MLYTATYRLHLSVNLDKSNRMIFRKDGERDIYIASTEAWWFGSNRLAVVYSCRYLGLTFLFTHLGFQAAGDNFA